jgi:putative AdoMet-dependent methyltransferase
MLDNKDFDLWANTYDKPVGITDEENTSPLIAYKRLMNMVFNSIINNKKSTVLEIGIGEGILSEGLYKKGYKITGIDISEEMVKKCKERMPLAKLIQYDFTKGLPENIKDKKFDCIVSTYTMHHLNEGEKIALINELSGVLSENGSIIIGDIGFQTRKRHDECMVLYSDIWNNSEYYFIYDEIKNNFTEEYKITYEQISDYTGICKINKIKREIKE